MKWIEEIIKVLKQNNGEAMHYATIAELVVENNPEITETNATPNQTVNQYLNNNSTLFEKVARGIYKLKDDSIQENVEYSEIPAEEIDKIRQEESRKLIVIGGVKYEKRIFEKDLRNKLQEVSKTEKDVPILDKVYFIQGENYGNYNEVMMNLMEGSGGVHCMAAEEPNFEKWG